MDTLQELKDKIAKKGMQDELTTKMHAEFYVSPETELRNRVLIMLDECRRRNLAPEKLRKIYGLTAEQVDKYKNYFENK